LWITVLTSSNGETVVLTCGIAREKNASSTILRIKRERGANTCSPFGSSYRFYLDNLARFLAPLRLA